MEKDILVVKGGSLPKVDRCLDELKRMTEMELIMEEPVSTQGWISVDSRLPDGGGMEGVDGYVAVVNLKKENGDGGTDVSVPDEGDGDSVSVGASDGREGNGSADVCMEVVDLKKNGVEERDVSLVSTSVKKDKDDSKEAGSETGETETDNGSSESESHDSSSSSSSSSSSEEEDDDDGDDRSSGKGKKMDEVIDFEEGEIRDLDPEELVLNSDGEEEMAVKGPIRSKNELEVLPPVPPVNVVLERHHQPLPVGVISSIMGTRVIVEGLVTHNPLNEGSILWITESRSPLGLVDEIFGPVKNPYYVVRYNSDKEVPSGISEGTAVSFVMAFANHILNETTLYKKGYDASGENDEELNGEVEFSDDEKEAEYRRSLRQAKRSMDNGRHGHQEAFDKKRMQSDRRKVRSKGTEFRKYEQPPVPCAPASIGQTPPCAPGQVQVPPVAGNPGYGSSTFSFGAGHACGSGLPAVPAISHAVQPGGFFGLPQQNLLMQQPNAVWAHGVPPQQPNMGLPGIFPMNGMPCQQLQDHHPYHQLQHQVHQNQVFPGSSSAKPFQLQFSPNQGTPPNMAWLGGPPNLSFGPMCSGPLGHGSFSQAPSWCANIGEQVSSGLSNNEQGYGQFPPANAQGASTMQFNSGTSSGIDRVPFARGGRYPFGRNG